jgi:uncharacterized membrane protein YgcG
MFARFLLTVLFLLAPVGVLAPVAAAQGSDTIYDEADVLSDSGEQQVQEAFDQTQEDTGQPLYAFLVPDTGVESQEARRGLLTQEAQEENVPQDAAVILVAANDRWTYSANIDGVSEDAVTEAMIPDFQRGDFAAGLVAGRTRSAPKRSGRTAGRRDTPPSGVAGRGGHPLAEPAPGQATPRRRAPGR